ncbi:NBS resistance protein, partial [Trifolium medium]|nr:NBS resistance protein [Trifolium medium]
LVDLDLSQRIFDEILVEREGYAFKLSVVYERLPEFCHHCHVVGHNVSICKWLHPPRVEQKIDIKKKELHEINKKIVKQEYVARAIAQSEVLLQQKHPVVTQKDDNLKVVAEGKKLATEVPEVDNEHATTDEIVTPTPKSSTAVRQKEVSATTEIEVQNLTSQTHAEPVHQQFVENNNDSRLEIETPVLH